MKVTSVCPDTGALFVALITSGTQAWGVRPSHGAGFKCHVGKWVAVVTSAAQGGQVVAVAKLARILTNAECAEAFTILRDPERAVQLAARGLAA